jgi:hypothetical protein
MELFVAGSGPVPESCGRGNNLLGYIKGELCIDHLTQNNIAS